MAITVITDTEPLPGQFLSRRVRSWERGIVYNPEKGSLEIRRIKKIVKDTEIEYMTCPLPSHPNSVNLFLYRHDSKDCKFTTGEREKVFIGRLNLEKLGVRNQLSRVFGQLKTLYIVKHSVAQPGIEASNEREESGAHG